ncbi:MAG: hypothetical protein RLZZ272_1478 [Actinomycetota bacterium]|jgi:hypothetical protein
MTDRERTRWTPLRAFRTPLRGHVFAAPPADGMELAADAPVRLRREPGNPADPLAVAVWTVAGEGGPWRLGYLDRGVAARIAPRLDDGLELHGRLEGWVSEPRGRWTRPLLRVEPAQPAPSEGASRGTTEGDARTGLAQRPPGVRRRILGTVRATRDEVAG